MGMMQWLENSQLAYWVGGSLWGYPIMLTLHAVGLAIIVGISAMLDLRVLGYGKRMPLSGMVKLMPVAWFGFVVNLISGGALFTSQATFYVTNIPFIFKITGILIAVILIAIQQKQLLQNGDEWDANGVAGAGKAVAIISLVCWSVAMIGGRLIAYI